MAPNGDALCHALREGEAAVDAEAVEAYAQARAAVATSVAACRWLPEAATNVRVSLDRVSVPQFHASEAEVLGWPS